jgi:hypothetical protein
MRDFNYENPTLQNANCIATDCNCLLFCVVKIFWAAFFVGLSWNVLHIPMGQAGAILSRFLLAFRFNRLGGL